MEEAAEAVVSIRVDDFYNHVKADLKKQFKIPLDKITTLPVVNQHCPGISFNKVDSRATLAANRDLCKFWVEHYGAGEVKSTLNGGGYEYTPESKYHYRTIERWKEAHASARQINAK